MSDHLDAPGLTSPAMDTRVDITDVYAFQKPDHPDRTVLILNVNPLAPTHANEFRSDAVYEMFVDINGDAKPEISFQFLFNAKTDRGEQSASVLRTDLTPNLDVSQVTRDRTISLVTQAPVSLTSEAHITRGHEGTLFFAGLRSDPFFFDLMGFLNGLKFTGADFFIDKNVYGIALEVPNYLLGPNPKIGIWTRTLVPTTLQPGRMAQADQMGRPGINTVFNHGNDKNIFNVTQPADQAMTRTTDGSTFLESFQSTLETLGGYSPTQAANIANILLPDILTFDYSSTAGFLNGRRLQDDVIDIALNLISNGKVTGDGAGPHTDYLAEFPYLGNPHA
jgi:hypothetical protein